MVKSFKQHIIEETEGSELGHYPHAFKVVDTAISHMYQDAAASQKTFVAKGHRKALAAAEAHLAQHFSGKKSQALGKDAGTSDQTYDGPAHPLNAQLGKHAKVLHSLINKEAKGRNY
jgi:hypothetical protein